MKAEIAVVNLDLIKPHSRVFVDTISDMDVISVNTPSDFALGRISSIDVMVHFYVKAGNLGCESILPRYIEKVTPPDVKKLGYIVTVDSVLIAKVNEHPERYVPPICFELAEQFEVFKNLVVDKPYTVVACRQTHPQAMPLDQIRQTLKLPETVKLMACDTKDRRQVKLALREFLEVVGQTTDVGMILQLVDVLRD